MNKLAPSLLALAVTASLLPSVAQAQLKITEVQSAENITPNATVADWWELTNLGNSIISLAGYKMDDNSDLFANSVALTGITSINPGESVIFTEGLTATQFRTWWNLSLSVQVGTYSGAGVGLGSGGDHVNLFDSTGALVDQVVFTTATTGTSFEFDGSGVSGRSPTGLSVNGVNGAFLSGNNDIGSPGVIAPVPEPSTFALAGLGLAALIGFRRSKA